MLIDTSALTAILFNEPEAARLITAIGADEAPKVAAPSLVEAAMVVRARKGQQGEIALDALLQSAEIEVVEMSAEAVGFARAGYRQYGKGSGTPGILNFGDVLVYGVAKALGEPLLFKGNDFSRTDVVAAIY